MACVRRKEFIAGICLQHTIGERPKVPLCIVHLIGELYVNGF